MRSRARSSILALIFVLAAQPRPALADTVDAAAKPYIVGGSWLVGLIFAAIGLFFVGKGVRYRRMASAMAAWPSAEGRVLASGVLTRVDRSGERGDLTRYIPQVRYAYAAGGKAHESDVVQVGLGDFGYAVEAQAREHAGRYPVGAKVKVRHDPADPAGAVLETGQVGGGRQIFAGTLFLLVGLGAIAVAIWVGTLAAR